MTTAEPVSADQRLLAVLAGLKADAAKVAAQAAATPEQSTEHEWMAAGILWAVNALEVEVLRKPGAE